MPGALGQEQGTRALHPHQAPPSQPTSVSETPPPLEAQLDAWNRPCHHPRLGARPGSGMWVTTSVSSPAERDGHVHTGWLGCQDQGVTAF